MHTIRYFDVPGHATRRSFSVYIAAAIPESGGTVELYVGKTGDNRDGCNPVISRAGNHFSHNKIHSQLRNKLAHDPSSYDFRYFYFSLAPYIVEEIARRGHIDAANEVERRVNTMLQELVEGVPRVKLLNPYKGVGYLSRAKKEIRSSLVGRPANLAIHELCQRAAKYARKCAAV